MDIDKLDIGIMREMARGNIRNLLLLGPDEELRKSFRSIGRTLRVDQGTIRNRIRRLKENGLIRGWYLELNPMLFGRKLSCLMIDVQFDRDKRDVVRKISSVSGVAAICNYMGPSLHVLISCDNDESLAETSRIIIELSGGGEPIWVKRPTCIILSRLKESDWQIIKSLHEDPWKSYEQIAKEVGISTRTTRSRITKLASEGAIQVSVDVNFAGLKGVIPVSLIVFYFSPEEKSQIARRISNYVGDELFFAELGDPNIGVFALIVPNVPRLEEIGNWVRNQPGVKACRTLVLLDMTPINIISAEETEKLMMLEAAHPPIQSV